MPRQNLSHAYQAKISRQMRNFHYLQYGVKMKFSFVSLFEDLLKPYFEDSILARARKNGLFELDFINPRDFATNSYKKVDDYAIGGGAGLVLQAQPLFDALKSVEKRHFETLNAAKFDENLSTNLHAKINHKISRSEIFSDTKANFSEKLKQIYTSNPTSQALKFTENSKISSQNSVHFVFLSPVGKAFRQNDAKRLAKFRHICFVCGRYEGFDERIIEEFADEIFSVGDFVMTGGELGALALCDAIARNLPGVLGNEASLDDESFENSLLEAPTFTKPFEFTLIKDQKNQAFNDLPQNFALNSAKISNRHKILQSENSSDTEAKNPQNLSLKKQNPKKIKNFRAILEFLNGNHAIISDLKHKLALCKTKFFRPDLALRANLKDL